MQDRTDAASKVDWILAALAVAAFGWIVIESERIIWRLVYVDPMSWPDLMLGALAILLVLEATRRTLGWTLVIVTGVFLLYAWAGPFMPGIFEHKGVSPSLLIEHLYLVPEGLFNQITGIMATYLLVFLTFGTLLRLAGGDRVFMELAVAMSGRTAGGPAKAAIVASTLMGSVSGSTIANVVTTGAVTIPMMKRVGYEPHEAAAIETAAGTGGAVMPPVMGAGVFIMSELTGIPLATILLYSLLPALVYFGSLYGYVHIKAKKHGLGVLADVPSRSPLVTLSKGWPLLVPLGLLVYLLFRNYSPFYASAASVVALIAMSYLSPETRMSPSRAGPRTRSKYPRRTRAVGDFRERGRDHGRDHDYRAHVEGDVRDGGARWRIALRRNPPGRRRLHGDRARAARHEYLHHCLHAGGGSVERARRDPARGASDHFLVRADRDHYAASLHDRIRGGSHRGRQADADGVRGDACRSGAVPGAVHVRVYARALELLRARGLRLRGKPACSRVHDGGGGGLLPQPPGDP